MNQKYFKLLIILLAVAIIVPQITFAAWWNPLSWGIWNSIFHKQQNNITACPMYCAVNMLCGSDGKDYCNECIAKSKGATVAHQGKCSPSSDQTAKYFEIKELGLKFRITDDIKDLTYSINSGNSEFTIVRFSTKSLEKLGGKYCTVANAPLGTIKIFQKDPAIPGGIEITYLIKSDNLYVTYNSPQDACSTVKTIQDLQTNQIHSLAAALKTIVSTKNYTDQTTSWKTYSIEPGPGSEISIKYPQNWDASDLSFSCNGSVLAVISPVRVNLSGYNNISVAYLVQFCDSKLIYQGFIKAPLNHQPTELDKVILSTNELRSTNEYKIAQQIILSLSNIIINTTPPINQTTNCVDSDGGLNFYLKGDLTIKNIDGSFTTETDFCLNNIILSEQYCPGTTKNHHIEYSCPNGCNNGACIK